MLSDSEIRANLAANVRRLLHSRGLSQAELARLTRESEMNISRVVRGENVVRTGIVVRIAEALDVSIDRLVAARAEKTLQKTAEAGQIGIDRA